MRQIGVAHERADANAAIISMLDAIKASGAFDGVHLVPVSRYEQIAAGLHRRRQP